MDVIWNECSNQSEVAQATLYLCYLPFEELIPDSAHGFNHASDQKPWSVFPGHWHEPLTAETFESLVKGIPIPSLDYDHDQIVSWINPVDRIMPLELSSMDLDHTNQSENTNVAASSSTSNRKVRTYHSKRTRIQNMVDREVSKQVAKQMARQSNRGKASKSLAKVQNKVQDKTQHASATTDKSKPAKIKSNLASVMKPWIQERYEAKYQDVKMVSAAAEKGHGLPPIDANTLDFGFESGRFNTHLCKPWLLSYERDHLDFCFQSSVRF